jgi:CubicO group peptidase (beta-lactamase class C family)
MAKVQALMSNKGVSGGVQLLSSSAPDMVFDEQANGIDLVLGVPVRMGMGYGLNGNPPMSPNPRTCFWGGWGGSLVMNDLDVRMTFCYAMNHMYIGEAGTLGDDRGLSLAMAAYQSL